MSYRLVNSKEPVLRMMLSSTRIQLRFFLSILLLIYLYVLSNYIFVYFMNVSLLTFLSLFTYTRVIYCFSFPKRERKLNALADCILNISQEEDNNTFTTRVAASVFVTFVGEHVLLFVVV